MDRLVSRSEPQSGSYSSSAVRDEAQDVYLSELLSYSLERLNKEPELLKADADRVRRQMQEVAVSHYQAFIIASEAVQSIRKEVTSIDRHLQSLVSDIPELTKGCNEFLEEAQCIVEKRALNRSMVTNHQTILDILEIPQLMDTCVRNGNYDEALDLEAFVSKMATMHAKLPVIQALAAEVRSITQVMLQQLLQRLRSTIQLPECLRVIAFLRRLSVFSEQDLRLQFLRCREAWLSDILSDMDQSDAYDYLKRLTDCHRVHLFDVVTQYRAIFADDSSSHLSEDAFVDGGLLYSWAMHRVRKYFRVLEETLPGIADGGSLASVLEHCMYCGMSLGRVGLDFRGLLPPLFELCVQHMFVRNMELAINTFEYVLDTHRWVAMPTMATSGRSSSDASSNDVSPPYSLMEHPPLATFVNGILASLNQLRHCCPSSLQPPLAAHLAHTLTRASDSLLRYHDTRVVRSPDAALFLAMCRAFVDVACPYSVLCFNRCYPGSSSLIDQRRITDSVRKLLLSNVAAQSDKSGAKAKSGREEIVGGGEEGGEGPERALDNDVTTGQRTAILNGNLKEDQLHFNGIDGKLRYNSSGSNGSPHAQESQVIDNIDLVGHTPSGSNQSMQLLSQEIKSESQPSESPIQG